MLLKLYNENPNTNHIYRIVEVLRNGGIVIIPTDTLYAFACDLFNKNAIERIIKIKNKDLRRTNLSFICNELSQISEFAKMDDLSFKLIKKNLPGPFTFILDGSKNLPKLFQNKKTVGIRMPDNKIVNEIIKALGHPMMTSSIFHNEDSEYMINPELIEEEYGKLVDLVIDGGEGDVVSSTIIDCTSENPEIVRQGKGELIY